jgi:hypothetical protein
MPRELAPVPERQSCLWRDDDGPEKLLSPPARPCRWQAEVPLTLPVAHAEAVIHANARQLRQGLESACTRFCRIAVAVVDPRQFNQLVAAHGNKSRLLGAVTMHLVRSLLGAAPDDQPVTVICDRHGGRQRYAPLLDAHWPERLVTRVEETPTVSRYQLASSADESCRADDIDISFRVGGEESLPVALASMVAKYVRELAMRRWNVYWQSRIAGIRPTAGYPVDARRFRDDLRRHVPATELADADFWRVV